MVLMHMYLYVPRGYTPGYVYRNLDDAVGQLLEDENCSSLSELSIELGTWWHEFDLENETVSIDDGARIEKIEVR